MSEFETDSSWFEPKIQLDEIFTKRGNIRGIAGRKISQDRLIEYKEDLSEFLNDFYKEFTPLFTLTKDNEINKSHVIVEKWNKFLFCSGSDFGITGPYKNFKDLAYDDNLDDFLLSGDIKLTFGNLDPKELEIIIPKHSKAVITLHEVSYTREAPYRVNSWSEYRPVVEVLVGDISEENNDRICIAINEAKIERIIPYLEQEWCEILKVVELSNLVDFRHHIDGFFYFSGKLTRSSFINYIRSYEYTNCIVYKDFSSAIERYYGHFNMDEYAWIHKSRLEKIKLMIKKHAEKTLENLIYAIDGPTPSWIPDEKDLDSILKQVKSGNYLKIREQYRESYCEVLDQKRRDKYNAKSAKDREKWNLRREEKEAERRQKIILRNIDIKIDKLLQGVRNKKKRLMKLKKQKNKK